MKIGEELRNLRRKLERLETQTVNNLTDILDKETDLDFTVNELYDEDEGLYVVISAEGKNDYIYITLVRDFSDFNIDIYTEEDEIYREQLEKILNNN